jgi:hypothetical protein
MTARTFVIRLRGHRFGVMTRVLGCVTGEGCAKLLGVSATTIYRAQHDPVSAAFIAQTLGALGARSAELAPLNLVPSFDQLFEVVTVDEPGRINGDPLP